MTRVAFRSPGHAFSKCITYSMLKHAWLGGGGTLLPIPPPSRQIDHHSPKNACNNTGWAHRHAPFPASLPRSQMNTSTIKSQKDLDDLMGEPSEFFPTHACDVYLPIGKNWHTKSWIRINVGVVWMIYCQYGSIMCTDTAFISWICIPNVTMSLYTRFLMKYISKC